jgi:hypothetical protein
LIPLSFKRDPHFRAACFHGKTFRMGPDSNFFEIFRDPLLRFGSMRALSRHRVSNIETEDMTIMQAFNAWRRICGRPLSVELVVWASHRFGRRICGRLILLIPRQRCSQRRCCSAGPRRAIGRSHDGPAR